MDCVPLALQGAQGPEVARWDAEPRNVTILRDDWGIAHVYGKTDADAVCGMIYAQAEDDSNRVEKNYINAMGRLAEAEGESKIARQIVPMVSAAFALPSDIDKTADSGLTSSRALALAMA